MNCVKRRVNWSWLSMFKIYSWDLQLPPLSVALAWVQFISTVYVPLAFCRKLTEINGCVQRAFISEHIAVCETVWVRLKINYHPLTQSTCYIGWHLHLVGYGYLQVTDIQPDCKHCPMPAMANLHTNITSKHCPMSAMANLHTNITSKHCPMPAMVNLHTNITSKHCPMPGMANITI